MTQQARMPNIIVAVLISSLAIVPAAQAQSVQSNCSHTLESVMELPCCELQRLFCAGKVHAIPHGIMRGSIKYCTGGKLDQLKTRLGRNAWKGKRIDAIEGYSINHWFVGKLIKAKVYTGTSCIDGQPAIILDYRDSILWNGAWDEMREISPGLYLGILFICKHGQPERRMFFVVEPLPQPDCQP